METKETVLGQIGDRIEDGPLGQQLKELADIVTEYLESDEISHYANLLADKTMTVSHLVIDLLEELGLVDPESV